MAKVKGAVAASGLLTNFFQKKLPVSVEQVPGGEHRVPLCRVCLENVKSQKTLNG